MKKKTAAVAILTLPAHLDLPAAATLHEQLLGMRGEPIAIDASKVESLGGQCLQILLSAVVTWKADMTQLSFVKASTGFENGLRLLGMSVDALSERELIA